MDIAFNINRLGLIGLGATLTSLIRNCSNTAEVNLWFFCSRLQATDKINISKLLKSELFRGRVEYIDFNAKSIFGHLPSLHEDWTAYGRLLIPTYINAETCLYLDSDVIVLLDVLTIKEYEFDEHFLAAAYGCTISESLDKEFFIKKLGWSEQNYYFNSGILFFNIKKWIEHSIDSQWRELSSKYSNNLISHDQTILNAICKGDFAYLSPNFNNAWYPVEEIPANHKDSILHFVGSPKPWDLFGKTLHKGHSIWLSYNNIEWAKTYSSISFRGILRGWNIRRSIIRNALKRINLISPLAGKVLNYSAVNNGK